MKHKQPQHKCTTHNKWPPPTSYPLVVVRPSKTKHIVQADGHIFMSKLAFLIAATFNIQLLLLLLATNYHQVQAQEFIHQTSQQFPSAPQQQVRNSMQWNSQHGGYSNLLVSFDQLLPNYHQHHSQHNHQATNSHKLQLDALVSNLQSLLHDTSSLMYDALGGNAFIRDVQILVPLAWNSSLHELLPKPNYPIVKDRRVKYSAADIVVGFDEPASGQVPYALQHDECGKQGLSIHLPASFATSNEFSSRIKARALLRELAAYRYGIFKESGFRNDPMYPQHSSLAGFGSSSLSLSSAGSVMMSTTTKQQQQHNNNKRLAQVITQLSVEQLVVKTPANDKELGIRGFDEKLDECRFDTDIGSGFPKASSSSCMPMFVDMGIQNMSTLLYLNNGASMSSSMLGTSQQQLPISSLNLMNSDPFLWRAPQSGSLAASAAMHKIVGVHSHGALIDSIKWHFCGQNFPPSMSPSNLLINQQQQQPQNHVHNQLTTNKQNLMCNERSALDVIKSHEDFRHLATSGSNLAKSFNNDRQTSFQQQQMPPQVQVNFVLEAAPRFVVGVEYTQALMSGATRLESQLIDAALAKFFALDLITDSEISIVWFGQRKARRQNFKRLDSNLDARLALYNPNFNPWPEPQSYLTANELASMGLKHASLATKSNSLNVTRGFASFATLANEVASLVAHRAAAFDDQGFDLLIITSGLFIDDDVRLEDAARALAALPARPTLHLIVYPVSALSTLVSYNIGNSLTNLIPETELATLKAHRIAKLTMIEKLTGAKVHFVRELLDSQADVRVSTLTQLFELTEHVAKGNSWDSSDSLVTLSSKLVDATKSPFTSSPNASVNFEFKFSVDATIDNELIVGFLDPFVKPKQLTGSATGSNLNSNTGTGMGLSPIALGYNNLASTTTIGAGSSLQQLTNSAAKSGKLFNIKNLELRAPTGALILCDNPDSLGQISGSNDNEAALLAANSGEFQFAYRSQTKIAGFHLRAPLLADLAAKGRLVGTWTLSGSSDEPIQTSGVALARVSKSQNTTWTSCWLQTSDEPLATSISGSTTDEEVQQQQQQQKFRVTKAFARIHVAPNHAIPDDVVTRLEVQDELGNVVQSSEMLDDGLGAPDMTKNDGIHSTLITRALKPGFYKVAVELSHASSSVSGSVHASLRHRLATPLSTHNVPLPAATAPGTAAGLDTACCGSAILAQPDTPTPRVKYLTRRTYCGTFYVEPAPTAPTQPALRPPPSLPAVHSLSVENVEQDTRRVTLKWSEPLIDISPIASSSALITSAFVEGGSSTMDASEWTGSFTGSSSTDTYSTDESSSTADASLSSNRPARASPQQQQQASRVLPRRGSPASNSNIGSLEVDEERDVDAALDALAPSDSSSASRSIVELSPPASSRSPTNRRVHNHGGITQLAHPLQQVSYEFKLFTDRDFARMPFDAKPAVGFTLSEVSLSFDSLSPALSSSNSLAVASSNNYFGGVKHATVRVPFQPQGIYYIAMRIRSTRNSQVSSPVSNIVAFWLRNNVTGDSLAEVYGTIAASFDSAGNAYGPNGEPLERSPSFVLRAPGSVEGALVIVVVGVSALALCVACVALVSCLVAGARHQQRAKKDAAKKSNRLESSIGSNIHKTTNSSNSKHNDDDDKKPVTGSGSSSASSQQSEAVCSASASSAASSSGSQDTSAAHDVEVSRLCLPPDMQRRSYQLYQHQKMVSELQLRQQQISSSLTGSAALTAGHYDYLQNQSQNQQQAYSQYTTNLQQNNYSSAPMFDDSALYLQQQQQQQQVLNQFTTPSDNVDWTSSSTNDPTTQLTWQNGANYQQQPPPVGDMNENGLGVALGPLPAWSSPVILGNNVINNDAVAASPRPPSLSLGVQPAPTLHRVSSPALDGVLDAGASCGIGHNGVGVYSGSELGSSSADASYAAAAARFASNYPAYFAGIADHQVSSSSIQQQQQQQHHVPVPDDFEHYANSRAAWHNQRISQQQLVTSNDDEYACVDKSAVSQV